MKNRLFTLPNILTLMNLLCGTIGVVSFISLDTHEALRASCILMFAAAVFDFSDGFAARLTKQYSAIGVQLDSLADMVSFGLLPAIIALKIYYVTGGYGWWGVIVLCIVLFSALRLARFNVEDSGDNEFRGLPTPANALLIGSAGWLLSDNLGVTYNSWVPWAVLACCVLLSLLLISSVKMFSLKFRGFSFRENAVRYVFLFFSLLLVIFNGVWGVGLAIILYILTSVITALACRRQRAA